MKRFTAAIVLMLGCAGVGAQAPEPVNICDRTTQVRDAILAQIPSTDCNAVPPSELAGITSLDLADSGILALKADDFADLTGLQGVRLDGNPGAPFTLTVSPQYLSFSDFSPVPDNFQTHENVRVRLTLPEGAPRRITADLVVTDATPTNLSLVIRAGSTQTLAVRLSRVPGAGDSGVFGLALRSLTLGGSDADYSGLSVRFDIPFNICDRTRQVRDAILAQVPSTDCNAVPPSELAGITDLDLSASGPGAGLGSLAAGDFSGLTGLTTLDLSNHRLTALPGGIFLDLISLQELQLGADEEADGGLSALPADVFLNLSNLTILNLSDNQLETLPADIFSSLTNLEDLTLIGNALSTLPASVFSGLTNLDFLYLSNNAFATLPAGIFSGLSLDTLDLTNNAFSTLPPGVFSGLAGLEYLNLQDNPEAPFDFVIRPQSVPREASDDPADVRLKLVSRDALPRQVTARLALHGATFDSGLIPHPLIIPIGATESETVALTFDSSDRSGFNLIFWSLRTDDLGGAPNGFNGINIQTAGSPVRFVNVCARTSQIRDAILAQVPSIDCNAVPLSELAGVTGLDLADSGISALQEGDFDGLTGLQELRLDGNPGAPFALAAELSPWPPPDDFTSVEVRLTLPEGAPRSITADLAGTGVTLPSGSSLTIPTGTTQSGAVRIDRPSGSGAFGLTLRSLTLGGSDAAYSGLSIGVNIPVNICDRTSQVRDAILAEIPSTDCLTVPMSELAAVTTLNLSASNLGAGLGSLAAGDLSALTGLTFLTLFNHELETLPAGIFSDLTSLRELELRADEDEEKGLLGLPANVFSRLSGLRILKLDNNRLETLPEGVFSELTNLEELSLFNNDLSELPAGVFSGLSNLRNLILTGNPGAPFALLIRPDFAPREATDSTSSARVKLVLREGAPREAAVRLTAPGATFDDNTDSRLISIPAGSTESRAVLLTFDSDRTESALTLTMESLGSGSFSGLTIETVPSPIRLVNICGRTRQVQDAILAQVPGIGCIAVPAVLLSDIAGLDLANPNPGSSSGILALKADDFAGLPSLQTLNLEDNSLKTLPAGIFSGLTNLQGVRLRGNEGAPFTLTVELSPWPPPDDFTEVEVRLTLPEGAPRSITANLTATGVTLSPGSSLTIPTGSTQSAPVSITRPSGSGDFDLILDSLPLGGSNANYNGLDIRSGIVGAVVDICGRTEQIRDEILSQIPSADCSAVPGLELQDIELLELPFSRVGKISSLRASDFSNLGGLETLSLDGHDLTELPDGIFSDLDSLETLDLDFNNFFSFSTTVFSNLTSLRTLSLNVGFSSIGTFGDPHPSSLSTLPADIFSGLLALETLDLSANEFSTLPADIFSPLTNLRTLDLGDYESLTLPAGIFSGLINLETLDLSDSGLTALPADVFSDLTSLRVLQLPSNSLSVLPAGVFSGLTNLESLNLLGNPGAPFEFLIRPEFVPREASDGDADARVKLVLREGAPRGVTALLALTGATFDGAASSELMILGGATESEPVPLTLSPGGTEFTAVLTVDSLTPGNFLGFTIVPETASTLLHFINICNRTDRVRDEILDETSTAGDRCEGVLVWDLERITRLHLSNGVVSSLQAGDFAGLDALEILNLDFNPSLNALPAGIFSGLDNLHTLNLSSNALGALPAGVFSGLTNLERVRLSGNPGAPFELLVRPELGSHPTGATVKLVLREGAPRRIRVPLMVAGATFDGLTASRLMEIPTGGVESETVTLTPVPGITDFSLSFGDLSLGGGIFDYSGMNIITAAPATGFVNICNRTAQVQDAILAQVSAPGCGAVLPSELEAITELNLGFPVQISSLQAGDFSRLTGLTTLHLNGLVLSALPTGIFSDLGNLETLNLSGNRFLALPADVFSGLTARLSTLHLNAAFAPSVETLPDGVFSGLTGLSTLWLHDNGLPALSGDVFSGLANLRTLGLTNAGLSTLPATIFSELSGLRALELRNNSIKTLPAGVFSGLTELTGVDLSDNPGTTFTLTVRPQSVPLPVSEELTGARLKLVLIEGAPRETTVRLAVAVATLDDGASNRLMMIPAGSTESEAVTLALASGRTDFELTLTLVVPPGSSEFELRYPGMAIAAAPSPIGFVNICAKTRQVRDAILKQTTSASCNAVLSSELQTIVRLNLSESEVGQISSLQADDFSELSGLRGLDLSGHDLTELPDDVFSGLSGLRTLDLSTNNLSVFSADVFSGLSGLRTLELNNSFDVFDPALDPAPDPAPNPGGVNTGESIETLPDGIFSGLDSLEELRLGSNGFSSLPAGIFSPLDNLDLLHLVNNKLSTLSADVFSGLSSLFGLDLRGNRLDVLPADVFSELPGLQGLDLSSNVIATLPDGIFSGLTELFGVNLADNPGAPFQLSIRPEFVPLQATDGSNSARVKLVLREGAPREVEVLLTTSGAAFSGTFDRRTLTIPVGSTESVSIELTLLSGRTDFVLDLTVEGLGGSNENYIGLTIEPEARLALFVNICDRTSQVMTAILAATPSDDRCEAVFASELERITSLLLPSQNIQSLQADDFARLSGLRTLDLSGNNLSALPAGVFSGLTGLREVRLDDNPGAPFMLTATPEFAPSPLPGNFLSAMVRLMLLEGAPRDITANLVESSTTFSPDAALTIPRGSTLSRAVMMTRPSGAVAFELRLDSFALGGIGSNYSGLDIRFAIGGAAEAVELINVCDRTDAVEAAILEATPSEDRCEAVLVSELEQIAALALSGRSIPFLREGDFERMPSLRTLDLSDNALSALPADVFSPLSGLRTLDLSDNHLSALSADDLSELTSLETLDLAENDVSVLPADVFSESATLTAINLSGNALSALPAEIFSGLSGLQGVRLGGNPGAPFPLTVRLEYTPSPLPDDFTSAMVRLTLSEGAPREITANLTATGLTLPPPGGSSVTIPTGSISSREVSITRPSGAGAFELRLGSFSLGGINSNYDGLDFRFDIDGAEEAVALVNVCGRTAQVRDAILDATPASERCEAVLPAELAGITDLDLLNANPSASSGILALQADDFSGLAELQTLDLRDNSLRALPVGVFSGLTELTTLRLDGNLGSPFTLAIRYGVESLGTLDNPQGFLVRAVLDEGAPRPVTVSFFVAGDTYHSPGEVRIETGSTQSGALAVSPDAITIVHERIELGGPNANYDGFDVAAKTLSFDAEGGLAFTVEEGGEVELTVAFDPAPLVDRRIRYGVIGGGVPGAAAADEQDYSTTGFFTVRAGETTANLAITINDDADAEPTRESFSVWLVLTEAGDYVPVSPATAAVTINEGVCDRTFRDALLAAVGETDCAAVVDLSGVTELVVNTRNVPGLEVSDFAGLSGLESLVLSDSGSPDGAIRGLTSLPAQVFDGLVNLRRLDLSRNSLQADDLPGGIFRRLGGLTSLNLSHNDLGGGGQSLADGLFEALDKLETLRLDFNPGLRLPAEIFAGLGSVRTLGLRDTGVSFDLRFEEEPDLSPTDGVRGYRLVVGLGAPHRFTLDLDVEGAAVTPPSVTLAVGSTRSAAFVVTQAAGSSPRLVHSDVAAIEDEENGIDFNPAPAARFDEIGPSVTGNLLFYSSPGPDGLYPVGAEMRIAVLFDEPVRVDPGGSGGVPSLSLLLRGRGGVESPVRYDAGATAFAHNADTSVADNNDVIFSFTVGNPFTDETDVVIGEDALNPGSGGNPGGITDLEGNPSASLSLVGRTISRRIYHLRFDPAELRTFVGAELDEQTLRTLHFETPDGSPRLPDGHEVAIAFTSATGGDNFAGASVHDPADDDALLWRPTFTRTETSRPVRVRVNAANVGNGVPGGLTTIEASLFSHSGTPRGDFGLRVVPASLLVGVVPLEEVPSQASHQAVWSFEHIQPVVLRAGSERTLSITTEGDSLQPGEQWQITDVEYEGSAGVSVVGDHPFQPGSSLDRPFASFSEVEFRLDAARSAPGGFGTLIVHGRVFDIEKNVLSTRIEVVPAVIGVEVKPFREFLSARTYGLAFDRENVAVLADTPMEVTLNLLDPENSLSSYGDIDVTLSLRGGDGTVSPATATLNHLNQSIDVTVTVAALPDFANDDRTLLLTAEAAPELEARVTAAQLAMTVTPPTLDVVLTPTQPLSVPIGATRTVSVRLAPPQGAALPRVGTRWTVPVDLDLEGGENAGLPPEDGEVDLVNLSPSRVTLTAEVTDAGLTAQRVEVKVGAETSATQQSLVLTATPEPQDGVRLVPAALPVNVVPPRREFGFRVASVDGNEVLERGQLFTIADAETLAWHDATDDGVLFVTRRNKAISNTPGNPAPSANPGVTITSPAQVSEVFLDLTGDALTPDERVTVTLTWYTSEGDASDDRAYINGLSAAFGLNPDLIPLDTTWVWMWDGQTLLTDIYSSQAEVVFTQDRRRIRLTFYPAPQLHPQTSLVLEASVSDARERALNAEVSYGSFGMGARHTRALAGDGVSETALVFPENDLCLQPGESREMRLEVRSAGARDDDLNNLTHEVLLFWGDDNSTATISVEPAGPLRMRIRPGENPRAVETLTITAAKTAEPGESLSLRALPRDYSSREGHRLTQIVNGGGSANICITPRQFDLRFAPPRVAVQQGAVLPVTVALESAELVGDESVQVALSSVRGDVSIVPSEVTMTPAVTSATVNVRVAADASTGLLAVVASVSGAQEAALKANFNSGVLSLAVSEEPPPRRFGLTLEYVDGNLDGSGSPPPLRWDEAARVALSLTAEEPLAVLRPGEEMLVTVALDGTGLVVGTEDLPAAPSITVRMDELDVPEILTLSVDDSTLSVDGSAQSQLLLASVSAPRSRNSNALFTPAALDVDVVPHVLEDDPSRIFALHWVESNNPTASTTREVLLSANTGDEVYLKLEHKRGNPLVSGEDVVVHLQALGVGVAASSSARFVLGNDFSSAIDLRIAPNAPRQRAVLPARVSRELSLALDARFRPAFLEIDVTPLAPVAEVLQERRYDLRFDRPLVELVAGDTTEVRVLVDGPAPLTTGESLTFSLDAPGLMVSPPELSLGVGATSAMLAISVPAGVWNQWGGVYLDAEITERRVPGANFVVNRLPVQVLQRVEVQFLDGVPPRIVAGASADESTPVTVVLTAVPEGAELTGYEEVRVRLAGTDAVGAEEVTFEPEVFTLTARSPQREVMIRAGPQMRGPVRGGERQMTTVTAELEMLSKHLGVVLREERAALPMRLVPEFRIGFSEKVVTLVPGSMIRATEMVTFGVLGPSAPLGSHGETIRLEFRDLDSRAFRWFPNPQGVIAVETGTDAIPRNLELSEAPSLSTRIDVTISASDAAAVPHNYVLQPGDLTSVVLDHPYAEVEGLEFKASASTEILAVRVVESVSFVTRFEPTTPIAVEQGRSETFRVTTEPYLVPGESAVVTVTLPENSGVSLTPALADPGVALSGTRRSRRLEVRASGAVDIGSLIHGEVSLVPASPDLSTAAPPAQPYFAVRVSTPQMTLELVSLDDQPLGATLILPQKASTTVRVRVAGGELTAPQQLDLSFRVEVLTGSPPVSSSPTVSRRSLTLSPSEGLSAEVTIETGDFRNAGGSFVVHVAADDNVSLREHVELFVRVKRHSELRFDPDSLTLVRRGGPVETNFEIAPPLLGIEQIVLTPVVTGYAFAPVSPELDSVQTSLEISVRAGVTAPDSATVNAEESVSLNRFVFAEGVDFSYSDLSLTALRGVDLVLAPQASTSVSAGSSLEVAVTTDPPLEDVERTTVILELTDGLQAQAGRNVRIGADGDAEIVLSADVPMQLVTVSVDADHPPDELLELVASGTGENVGVLNGASLEIRVTDPEAMVSLRPETPGRTRLLAAPGAAATARLSIVPGTLHPLHEAVAEIEVVSPAQDDLTLIGPPLRTLTVSAASTEVVLQALTPGVAGTLRVTPAASSGVRFDPVELAVQVAQEVELSFSVSPLSPLALTPGGEAATVSLSFAGAGGATLTGVETLDVVWGANFPGIDASPARLTLTPAEPSTVVEVTAGPRVRGQSSAPGFGRAQLTASASLLGSALPTAALPVDLTADFRLSFDPTTITLIRAEPVSNTQTVRYGLIEGAGVSLPAPGERVNAGQQEVWSTVKPNVRVDGFGSFGPFVSNVPWRELQITVHDSAMTGVYTMRPEGMADFNPATDLSQASTLVTLGELSVEIVDPPPMRLVFDPPAVAIQQGRNARVTVTTDRPLGASRTATVTLMVMDPASRVTLDGGASVTVELGGSGPSAVDVIAAAASDAPLAPVEVRIDATRGVGDYVFDEPLPERLPVSVVLPRVNVVLTPDSGESVLIISVGGQASVQLSLEGYALQAPQQAVLQVRASDPRLQINPSRVTLTPGDLTETLRVSANEAFDGVITVSADSGVELTSTPTLPFEVVRNVNLVMTGPAGEEMLTMVAGESTDLRIETTPLLESDERVAVSLSLGDERGLRLNTREVTLSGSAPVATVTLTAVDPELDRVAVSAAGVGSGVIVRAGDSVLVTTLIAGEVAVTFEPVSPIEVEQGRSATFIVTTFPTLGTGQTVMVTLRADPAPGLRLLDDSNGEVAVSLARDNRWMTVEASAAVNAVIGLAAEVAVTATSTSPDDVDVLEAHPPLELVVTTPRVTLVFSPNRGLFLLEDSTAAVTLGLHPNDGLKEGQSARFEVTVDGAGSLLGSGGSPVDRLEMTLSADSTRDAVVVSATADVATPGVFRVAALEGARLREGTQTTMRVLVVPPFATASLVTDPDPFRLRTDSEGMVTLSLKNSTTGASYEFGPWTARLEATVAGRGLVVLPETFTLSAVSGAEEIVLTVTAGTDAETGVLTVRAADDSLVRLTEPVILTVEVSSGVQLRIRVFLEGALE